MSARIANLRLIIGAQKTATTSLYYQFEKHPGITTANIKETKYFADDSLYVKGVDHFLNTFYPNAPDTLPKLDIDPEYIFYPRCAQRIADTIGRDAKLTMILRNPVDRAYSQYNMEVFRRKEDMPFEKALQAEKGRIQSDYGLLYHSYVSRGLYYQQVKRFIDIFDDSSLQVLIFEEDFINDKDKAYREICSHFEIEYLPEYFNTDDNFNPRRAVKNKWIDNLIRGRVIEFKSLKKYPLYNKFSRAIRSAIFDANLTFETPPLSEEMRHQMMTQYFKTDIKKLEDLIKRDLSVWSNR